MKRYCFIIFSVILFFSIGLTAYSKWNIAIERFNSYRGTIGQQKIRMLLYPADNAKMVGNYYYVDQLKKIKLSGIIMADSIWIYEYNEQGDQKGRFEGIIDEKTGRFSGVWHSKDGVEKNFDLELIAVFAGLPDNIYSQAGAKSTDEVEKFAIELKNQILAKDKIQVALKIAYPIQVEIEGKKQQIKDRKEFCSRFEEIFNDAFRSSIQNCYPLNMEASARGIKFGDQGQIWLGYIKKKEAVKELKVTEINID